MKKFFLLILLIFINFADANDNSLFIEADTINSDSNIVNADGNVIVKNNDEKLLTDKLVYNKETKTIYTETNSKVLDKNGILFFNSGNVTNDLSQGTFYKGGLKFNNNIYILSSAVKKENENSYLAENTTYYVCPVNEEMELEYENVKKNINKKSNNCRSIFSVKSKNTKIDKEKKKVYLTNSFIYAFKIPIFYVPYFYTSKPFVDLVSGFDLPHIENLSEYGTGVYVPYVWYFKDKSSLKLDPVIYQYGSFATKFLYKKNSKNGYMNANFIYLFDNNISKNKKNIFGITEFDEGIYKNNRIFFKADGGQQFNKNSFLNFNINFTTDNYLYRDYLKEYDDFLESNINFSLIDFDNFNYANFNATGFQELKENANKRQKTTPYFIPRIDYHLTTKNIFDKDTLFVESNSTLLTSDLLNFNRNKYTRYYTDEKISYTFIKFNSKIKTNLNVYLDFYDKNKYFIDTSSESLTLKKNYTRIIPEFSFDIRSPQYLFNSKNVILEPIVQYYISNKSYKYNNFFIDEDSRKSSINMLNLFSENRFNGLDRREYGERINYGFNLDANTNLGRFSFKLGQGYRNVTDYKIIGFDKRFSDILSGFGYFNDHFSFDYIMNIDRVHKNIKTNSMLFNIFFDRFNFYSNYTYSYNKNSLNSEDFLKEIILGLMYKFDSGLSFSFGLTRDLDKKLNTEINATLDYTNDCFITGIEISKNDYSKSNNNESASFSFYFKLKNF